MEDTLKISICSEKNYIKKILNDITIKVIGLEIDSIIKIEITPFSTKCIVNINSNLLYIKYSSSFFYIYKDYDVNWILQDLDISLIPVQKGFIEHEKLYFSIYKYDALNMLKEDFSSINIANTNLNIRKFHQLKITENKNIEQHKSFFKKKFNFINFYSFFKNCENNFTDLASCYAEIYEKNIFVFRKTKAIEGNTLVHGNLNAENILIENKNIIFLDFENCFYGNSIIDFAIFYINSFFKKNKFISEISEFYPDQMDNLSDIYDLCLLRKCLDFIENITLFQATKNFSSKDQISNFILSLNYFNDIKEINSIYDSILNIINRSSV